MKRFGLGLLLFASLLILLWSVRVAYLAFTLRTNVAALSALQVSDLKRLDVPATAQALKDSRDAARALQVEAYPILFPLRYLTFAPDLAVIPPLINIAADLTSAAVDSFDTLAPLLPSPSLDKLAAQTQAQRPRIVAARAAVERAKQEQRSLAESVLFASYIERLNRLLPLLDAGLAALDLFSSPEPQSFLLLAQNQDELRATGGFISGAGIITLESGKIKELKIEDAYQIDDLTKPYPAPPEPLRVYMGAQLWLFRDANWAADFPTSAKAAASLYALGRGKKVAGVMAFDQTAIKNLVGVVGEVKLAYVKEPITAQNLELFMRSAWSTDPGQRTDEEWMAHRKDFMRDLGLALLQKLLNASTLNLDSAWTSLQTTLAEKHLLIFVAEPSLANTLATYNWDGALRFTQDYFFVVDSNVGFNKANANLLRVLTYQVNLATREAQLNVRYSLKGSPTVCKHEAQYGAGQYSELINRCYWNYLRVYVPPSTLLKESAKLPTPAESVWNKIPADGVLRQTGNELNQFFVVPLGGVVETWARYQLPPTVIKNDGSRTRYRLQIQKQAGAGETAMRVQVLIPASAEFISAAPVPTKREGALLTFDLLLQKDVTLEVLYR